MPQLESSLFSADKHRVYLKGAPDYIHATAVNVNTFIIIISTLCITDHV